VLAILRPSLLPNNEFDITGVLGKGNGDRLHLGVLSQAILTQLSANAALLEPTEWGSSVEGVVGVDPDSASPDVMSEGEGVLDALGDHTGRKTISGGIGASNHVGHVLELDDGHHRTEDLLLGDLHVVGNVGEHGWFNEEPLIAYAATATEKLGSLILAAFDIAQDLVELLFVHLRSLLSFGIERITNNSFACLLYAGIYELIIYLLMDIET